MAKLLKGGVTGSFGARYGTVTRKRYANIVALSRSWHTCPRCSFRKVRRLSVGIWYCAKCGGKFSGGAYLPTTKLGEVAFRSSRTGASVSSMTPKSVVLEPSLSGNLIRAPEEKETIRPKRSRAKAMQHPVTPEGAQTEV